MINPRKIYCSIFNHSFIQIKEDSRTCKICRTSEKRLQLSYNNIEHLRSYSDWRPAEFIESIVKVGDKVRILSEGEASSYWLTMESSIYKVRFMNPISNESIEMKQDPTLYTIL
jgi:hypothetical protein